MDVGGRVLDHVDADVLGGAVAEEGVVRLHAAADVEHAVAAVLLGGAACLVPEPRRERRPEQKGRRRTRWVAPKLAGPLDAAPLAFHRSDTTLVQSAFVDARRALITGIAGQDGSLLAELLLESGYEVFGVVRRATSEQFENLEAVRDRIELVQADLLDELSLVDALKTCRPHEVYNLASPSFVPMSWQPAGADRRVRGRRRDGAARVDPAASTRRSASTRRRRARSSASRARCRRPRRRRSRR